MAASVRARLLNLARRTGKPYNEILIQYALERFLFRKWGVKSPVDSWAVIFYFLHKRRVVVSTSEASRRRSGNVFE